jgi:hypothetical protein
VIVGNVMRLPLQKVLGAKEAPNVVPQLIIAHEEPCSLGPHGRIEPVPVVIGTNGGAVEVVGGIQLVEESTYRWTSGLCIRHPPLVEHLKEDANKISHV